MIEPKLSAALFDGAGPKYAPRRVMGCRVCKFSLWHAYLLTTLDSPFMSEGNVGLRELRAAVGACRTSFGDSRIRKPLLIPLWIHLWSFLCVLGSAIVPKRKRKARTPAEASDALQAPPNAKQRALQKYANQFLEYTGDYLINPEYVVVPRESAAGSTPRTPRGRFPDPFEHACELIRGGFPEERAWNMGIGLANFYRADLLRAGGADVDVMTEEERAFQESLPPEFRHGPKP